MKGWMNDESRMKGWMNDLEHPTCISLKKLSPDQKWSSTLWRFCIVLSIFDQVGAFNSLHINQSNTELKLFMWYLVISHNSFNCLIHSVRYWLVWSHPDHNQIKSNQIKSNQIKSNQIKNPIWLISFLYVPIIISCWTLCTIFRFFISSCSISLKLKHHVGNFILINMGSVLKQITQEKKLSNNRSFTWTGLNLKVTLKNNQFSCFQIKSLKVGYLYN